MRKFLTGAALACAIAGLGSSAYAQAPQCVLQDAKGATLLNMKRGDIVKFVHKDEALMRNVNAQGIPQLLGKVAAVKVEPRCTVTLLGNGGAKWGHMPVKQSGKLSVPAAHVYGASCACQ